MTGFPKTMELINKKIEELELFLNEEKPVSNYQCKLTKEEQISLFYKADLRVGTITEASKHPDS